MKSMLDLLVLRTDTCGRCMAWLAPFTLDFCLVWLVVVVTSESIFLNLPFLHLNVMTSAEMRAAPIKSLISNSSMQVD